MHLLTVLHREPSMLLGGDLLLRSTEEAPCLLLCLFSYYVKIMEIFAVHLIGQYLLSWKCYLG